MRTLSSLSWGMRETRRDDALCPLLFAFGVDLNWGVFEYWGRGKGYAYLRYETWELVFWISRRGSRKMWIQHKVVCGSEVFVVGQVPI